MRRFLAAVALLLATAGYVVLHPPENLAAGRGALATCPTRFGEWNGTELSFEDAVVEELKADDLLSRRYERGPDVAWLCIVYHQNKRYGAHDPQLCYESQGYIVERPERMRVNDGTPSGLEANRFLAERSHDRRLVYYWWTTAGLTTADKDAFRNRMAVSGALANHSWGAFVRVEALVRSDDPAATERALDDFAGQVARGLPKVFAAAQSGARPS
jgi:EpsI family protein